LPEQHFVFADPHTVIVDDQPLNDAETLLWKVCVLCEAHMRRHGTSSSDQQTNNR
jgi:hypothetical protein